MLNVWSGLLTYSNIIIIKKINIEEYERKKHQEEGQIM